VTAARRLLVAAAVLFGSVAVVAGRAGAAPTIGPNRIVLQTTAGDVVLELYPDVAPRTVAHVLALARDGAFDGMDFFRVVPGFVEQLDVTERTTPLPAAAQALAGQTVPLETSAALHHVRGVLSMAHYDGKPDSGGPSFSIVLGTQPTLDGKYTIFGDVAEGMDVVDEIAAVPLSGSRPVVPVVVQHAVVTDAAGLAAMTRRGPIPIGGTAASADVSTWPRLLLSTSMGDVLVILSPRDAPAHLALIEQLVRSGAYQGAALGRADPGQYVQWFPANPVTATSTLPVETGTVGNVAGALTIDSRDTEATPALTFLLADDHALDGRYTPVGWVTDGSDVLTALSHLPTAADHRPRQGVTIDKATIVTGGSVVVVHGLAATTTGHGSGTPWGAFGFLIAATALGVVIFLFSKRLTPALTASAGLLVVLVGFMGLWVGLAPSAGSDSQWLGVALFAGAIGVFRLMGRFERGRPLPPPPAEPAPSEAPPAVAVVEPLPALTSAVEPAVATPEPADPAPVVG